MRKIAESTLNASTIDILNVIRQNLSAQYQDTVPAVTQKEDIPAVKNNQTDRGTYNIKKNVNSCYSFCACINTYTG